MERPLTYSDLILRIMIPSPPKSAVLKSQNNVHVNTFIYDAIDITWKF